MKLIFSFKYIPYLMDQDGIKQYLVTCNNCTHRKYYGQRGCGHYKNVTITKGYKVTCDAYREAEIKRIRI